MKSYNIAFITGVALLMAAGCSGNKEVKSDRLDDRAKTEVTDADIRGQWYIENIVFSDSDYVRPDETSSSMKPYIVFEDSTYFIMTNCNSTDEDCLGRILPNISAIDVQNDSVVRLNGSVAAECILLRKVKTAIK